jgi:predicted PurR-regulated permease PerM
MRVRIIFPPLLVALVLIYLLNPIVARISRGRLKRGPATLLVYFVALVLISMMAFLITPIVTHQVSQVAKDWPHIRTEVVSTSHDVTDTLNSTFGTKLSADKVDCVLGSAGPNAPSDQRCQQISASIGSGIRNNLGRIAGIGFGVIEVLIVVVIGILVSLYLLMDLPNLRRDVLAMVPERHREEVRDVGGKIGRAMGSFFRGQLLVALAVGILSALGFWAIGLPFWFFIGALAGFFNLIPMVGPFIGGGIGFLVGLATGGVYLGVEAALVELVVQQLDNHILSPNIIGRSVQLHPVTIMLALLAGGTVAGFWGVFLAVPLVATVKIVGYHIWVTRVLGYEVSPYGASPTGPSPPSIVPRGKLTGEIETIDGEETPETESEAGVSRGPSEPETGVDPDQEDTHDSEPEDAHSHR